MAKMETGLGIQGYPGKCFRQINTVSQTFDVDGYDNTFKRQILINHNSI